MAKKSSVLQKSLKSFSGMPRAAKLLSLLILIITFVVGFYMGQADNFEPLGGSIGSPLAQQKDAYNTGYQKALEFARKKIENNSQSLVYPSRSAGNFISSAKVVSVSGNKIIVQFDASQIDIFGEGLTTQTVVIPENVKIEKRTYKSQEEIQKILDDYRQKEDDYRKALDEGKNPVYIPKTPVTYTSEIVAISDLKSDDLLNVFYEIDSSDPNVFLANSAEMLSK